MTYYLYLLAMLSIVQGLIPIWLSRRFVRYINLRINHQPGEYAPPAAVTVPCKGTDLGFDENILSILDQQYPDVEFLFVTGTSDDPAYHELARIIGMRPLVRARLLVAGLHTKRAQKLTNLLHAADHVSSDREVVVHLDADIRLRPNFLRYLIAPLQKEAVGATTGFPWYVPTKGRIGSIMRSIWGGGALPLLIDNRHNLASGAANAMRRNVYEASGVRRAMDGAVSDTFAITRSVKALGKQVVFVPQCMFVTPDNSDLLETVKWTTRQTTISRVYGPRFWWAVALSYSIATALLLTGVFVTGLGLTLGSRAFLIPGLLMLSLPVLQSLNARIMLRAIRTILPEVASQLDTLEWKYLLLAPLGSILIFINSVLSRTSNEINWRGIRYRLLSPTETEVLSVDDQ